MFLNEVKVGQKAIIKKTNNKRLLELGLIEDSIIKCTLDNPFKSPRGYFIKGVTIAIREEDAKKIEVDLL